MYLGWLFAPIALLFAWMLDRQSRVVFDYRNPSASDLRKIRKLPWHVLVSVEHRDPLKWLGIASMTLAIVGAWILSGSTSLMVWLAIILLGMFGVASSVFSIWWFVKIKFGKPQK